MLVLTAIGLAWPVAYVIMNNWLNKFAYRVDLDLNVFFFIGLAALFIVLLTIGYRSVKTAMANPVNVLKNQ